MVKKAAMGALWAFGKAVATQEVRHLLVATTLLAKWQGAVVDWLVREMVRLVGFGLPVGDSDLCCACDSLDFLCSFGSNLLKYLRLSSGCSLIFSELEMSAAQLVRNFSSSAQLVREPKRCDVSWAVSFGGWRSW